MFDERYRAFLEAYTIYKRIRARIYFNTEYAKASITDKKLLTNLHKEFPEFIKPPN